MVMTGGGWYGAIGMLGTGGCGKGVWLVFVGGASGADGTTCVSWGCEVWSLVEWGMASSSATKVAPDIF